MQLHTLTRVNRTAIHTFYLISLLTHNLYQQAHWTYRFLKEIIFQLI